MLTSVSHDLRTPLASIIGALSSLRSYRERYDEPTRDELLGTALSEAERLDRFVGNLLDMTRLDAGVIVPKRETVEVGDLVSTTLRRAAPRPEGSGRRLDRGARPADPVARLRAGRAGAVQHPGQCRQILGAGRPHRDRGPPRRSDRGRDRRARRRARASILPRSTGCSTSSTAPTTATGGAPAPGWASPSPRASSRSRAAPSRRAIEPGSQRSRIRGELSRHDRRRRRHPDRRGRAADPPPAAHDAGRADYRTLEAATGAEALSALRHHRPDLVLLDLGLPDIDGLPLIAQDPRSRAGADRRAVEPRRRGGQGGGARLPAPTTTSPSRSAPTS